MRTGFFASLPDRGAVRISGEDRRTFLQGLVTNDVNLLDRQVFVYSCLLTPQGKFQHDFFMSEQDDTIILECEGMNRTHDLAATLKKFRLRSKIDIQAIEKFDVFFGIGGDECDDPRHPAFGSRYYGRPEGLHPAPFDEWDRHRITLGIPDGSRDMIPGQSTLLECGLDRLNAISYDKGCYMGQELTARMTHRGLAKKHLIPLRSLNKTTLPPPGTDLRAEAGLIGEMRSSCCDVGLALIRDDMTDHLAAINLGTL